MNNNVDYYNILGVARDSSKDDIKKAYRKLAMQYHPDRNPDNPEAEDKLKAINEAYNILYDDEKRAQYDNPGLFGIDPLSDLFNGFGFRNFQGFNNRSAPDMHAPRRGRDIKIVVDVSIGKFILGGSEEVNFNYKDPCPICGGTGASVLEKCSKCNGMGSIMEHGRNGNMVFSRQMPCQVCSGRGSMTKEVCVSCNSGYIDKLLKTTIDIHPGTRDGEILHRGGLGISGINGGPPGDLFIKLRMNFPDVNNLTEEQKMLILKI